VALRDKLRRRVEPFLEPGEPVGQVFLAQAGPDPSLALLTPLVFWFTRYKVVATTDRAVLVLAASRLLPAKPRSLEARLPRTAPLGPPRGVLWSTVNLPDPLGKRTWVHRRFWGDVTAADRDAGFVPPA
jgi:hypothetical protein